MGAWLLIIVVAVTLILWRVIGVAGMIWRERAHVTAHCVQMDAAAASGAMLCERLARAGPRSASMRTGGNGSWRNGVPVT